jgi:HSP20 family protein
MANNMVRWNPFHDMVAMQNVMDRFFDEGWRPFTLFEESRTGAHALALDVHEDANGYTISSELPGVKAENIKVHVDGDFVVIEGEIPEQVVQKDDARPLVKERRYGQYSRRIRLPQSVDFDKAEARYEDGVLTLTLPKAAEAQPKSIQVKTGSKN